MTSPSFCPHPHWVSFRSAATHYPKDFLEYDHLRLSIGLEDADDLIKDISAALEDTFSN
ncbi:hypothetical protein GHO41_21040 [Pseudomonas sp. FSL R10-0399]|nr:hypothetical protein [Pseudomonas sp. FSL R10-0399]